MDLFSLILGMIIGCIIGVILMCCLIVGKGGQEDE